MTIKIIICRAQAAKLNTSHGRVCVEHRPGQPQNFVGPVAETCRVFRMVPSAPTGEDLEPREVTVAGRWCWAGAQGPWPRPVHTGLCHEGSGGVLLKRAAAGKSVQVDGPGAVTSLPPPTPADGAVPGTPPRCPRGLSLAQAALLEAQPVSSARPGCPHVVGLVLCPGQSSV